jgi:hypothetical protein
MILTFNVDAEQAKALVECYNVLTGEKKILIEAGKRYRRRDGEISGEIVAYDGDTYKYKDLDSNVKYTELGEYRPGETDDWDLIEEVPCNS